MASFHYIDNEVPWDAPAHYGEWDDAIEAGGSTIRQLAAASHPDRPSTGSGLGLRVETTAGDSAYVRKTGLAQVAPGESLAVGYWFRIASLPGDYTRICRLAGSAGSPYVDIVLYSGATGVRVAFFGDDGAPNWSNYIHPATGRWIYVAVRATRATTTVAADGNGELWMDGVSAGQVTGIDNFDRMGAASNVLSLGCVADARDGYQADFDEIKIADAYPPPTVPAPEGEYLTARRLCVLYRPACADSSQFADYCADELGVPRANLIPLPDAIGDETPADYTSFQTQIESGIDAYFALNPTVADNCAGFLVGFGVPGYFMHAGVKRSATGRLNRYGTAFSSGTDNPLYKPAEIERLSVSALRSAGAYLATRCDADTLADAKALIDRAATVAALPALPDSDKFYSDDPTYLASPACRHLRLLTASPGTYADDAFVWGDTAVPSFGDAGSRVAFADTSAGSGSSLRSGGDACRSALFTAGYAAAMGSADSAETVDAESFFEMLRIGGTFAEAVLVASAKVDSTGVAAGSALLAVNFPLGGTNIYLAEGDLEQMDWDAPAGYARADEETPEVHVALATGRRYVLAARKVSQHGVEERNTHVIAYVELDAQASLLPPAPAEPTDVTAELQTDGSILLGFACVPPAGFAPATSFEVFSDGGSGTLDLQTPVATITGVGADETDFEALVTPVSLPTKLAVRAVAAGRSGPMSRVVTVAAAPAPSAPVTL